MNGPDGLDQSQGSSLAVRTAAGFGWVVTWRLITRILGVGSTLILMRLLMPSDFGLIALALSVTQAVELLSALGVEDAVVRHPNPTRDTYDTAFTMAVLRACGNAAVIGIIAWPMAIFFGDLRLVPITIATAAGLIITGFENIGIVEFRRQLAYDRQLLLRAFPRLLSIAATMAVAFAFRSYWALVAGTLVNRLSGTALTYTFHPHRPRFTLSAWRDLAGFSLWVWFSSLVGMARDRIEVFVIGRLIGTLAVGIYSVALEIAVLPMSELMQPLASVLFSAFSQAAENDEESRHLFLRFLALSATIGIPAGVGIALLADPMAHIVLGANWLGAIPVIQVMAVLSALTTFGFLSRAVVEARGHMPAIFSANLAGGIIRFIGAVVFVSWLGVFGAAISVMIGWAIDQLMLFRVTCRLLSLPWGEIGRRFWRPLFASLAMAGAVILAGLHRGSPDSAVATQVFMLLVGMSFGAVIYTIVLTFVWSLAGRPQGAESDLLQALLRALARFRRRGIWRARASPNLPVLRRQHPN